jgi:hypothetical protein
MSDYAAFDVLIDNNDGTAVVVKVYNVTGSAALSDIAADSSGHVAGGTLAVAAGTKIRFSVQRADGLCGYAEQITT